MDLQKWVQDPDLLRQSLTHSSIVTNPNDSNERLEWLGDRVIELVVANWLFHKYPESEGHLTELKTSMINNLQLEMIARSIQLDKKIIMERRLMNMEKGVKRALASCFEAVVGAIFLDQGLTKATEFLTITMLSRPVKKVDSNHKGTLQNLCQKHGLNLPDYESTQSDNFRFKVIVRITEGNKRFAAIGESDETKKAAEQEAARKLVKQLRREFGE